MYHLYLLVNGDNRVSIPEKAVLHLKPCENSLIRWEKLYSFSFVQFAILSWRFIIYATGNTRQTKAEPAHSRLADVGNGSPDWMGRIICLFD